MTDKDDIAALKRKVEELERKVDPPKSAYVPMTEEQHRDWLHQMREKRMAMATPPSVGRDLAAAEPRGFMAGVLHDARAPTGPGMIPNSGGGDARQPVPSSTPGYVEPRPLTNPPGTNWVDAIAIADDARQRAELKRKLGKG
jgi:hypothetical protein